MLEDADWMKNSLTKLASSYFDFCACLYLELLCLVFQHIQREGSTRQVSTLSFS